ncbi:UvrB/UvrC motif-containing protein [Bacillus sp. SL00103]
MKKDKGKYFDHTRTYKQRRETKKAADRLYPLRKCATLPDRVCLYYHLGQCLRHACMTFLKKRISVPWTKSSGFSNGGHQQLKKNSPKKMQEAAEQLEFERAKELRDQIAYIDSTMEKQK